MSAPTTVKRLRFEDTVQYDTMTYSAWTTNYSKSAVFAILNDDDNKIYDITEWIGEFNFTHNEIDADGAGRDKKTGRMTRKFVATKHDIQVKLVDGVTQPIAHEFLMLLEDHNSHSFTLYWQHPCRDNAIKSSEFYCSTVNFGAMRWRKSDNVCYFTGMNFKVIQM